MCLLSPISSDKAWGMATQQGFGMKVGHFWPKNPQPLRDHNSPARRPFELQQVPVDAMFQELSNGGLPPIALFLSAAYFCNVLCIKISHAHHAPTNQILANCWHVSAWCGCDVAWFAVLHHSKACVGFWTTPKIPTNTSTTTPELAKGTKQGGRGPRVVLST